MEKIYTAKTEEAAKEQAVNEFAACGIEESDIEFEILERPVKELFGMKGEFKVRAFAAEPVKAAAKPAAEKKAAPAKKPAEKKAVPADKKAAEKKPAAKPAAKKAAPAAKKAAKPAAKKAPKKKELTVDDVVAKLTKKLDRKAAAKIEGKAAADIKLYGTFEAHMYIEVKDGKLTVAPYDYIERDLEVAISVENALAIAEGKLKLADALADGRLYVFGNVGIAAKIAKLFG